MSTTNYYNTLIEVAEDCPSKVAEIPPASANRRTVANIQYDLLKANPYQYNSDDVLFHVFMTRNNIAQAAITDERQTFFSKGQPCLRCSPLAKRYGWGFHCNAEGKVALYSVESSEYQELVKRTDVKHVKAMRNHA